MCNATVGRGFKDLSMHRLSSIKISDKIRSVKDQLLVYIFISAKGGISFERIE